jgi:Na+-driven multidrug efflux pump
MMALFDANRCFLNALNYTFVPTIVQLTGVPLHLAWAYYFVRVRDMGMLGVCYAQNITYLTLFLVITVYSWRIKKIKKAWFLPNEDCLEDIGDYIYLGGPGSLMMVIGYLGTDALILFAGLIGLRE